MKLLSILVIILSLIKSCVPDNIKKDSSDVAYKDSVVTDFFKRTQGAIAMDGGFSVALPDNKVIWFFGDTYVDHYDSATGTVPCLFQVRNSALLQPIDNWDWHQTKTLLSDTPGVRNYIKNDKHGDHWIWPSDGFLVGDTVFVFSNQLKSAKGGLGFKNGGAPEWAKISVPDMKIAGFSPMQDFGDIGFGNGFIKDKSGKYIYAYGSRLNRDSFSYEVFIARFPIANPSEKWHFWNGEDWDLDIKNAIPIAHMPGYSWHVAQVRNRYVIVSAEFSLTCDQGKNIYISSAENPIGPFSENKAIYTLDDILQGHYPFFYGVIMHPEYINDKDELLVTYCINSYSPCLNTCVDNRFNPKYYQLKAIRVPLKLINEDL